MRIRQQPFDPPQLVVSSHQRHAVTITRSMNRSRAPEDNAAGPLRVGGLSASGKSVMPP
jgi:hypothetical protein